MGKISVFQTKFYAHRLPQATVLPRKTLVLRYARLVRVCARPLFLAGETVRI